MLHCTVRLAVLFPEIRTPSAHEILVRSSERTLSLQHTAFSACWCTFNALPELAEIIAQSLSWAHDAGVACAGSVMMPSAWRTPTATIDRLEKQTTSSVLHLDRGNGDRLDRGKECCP